MNRRTFLKFAGSTICFSPMLQARCAAAAKGLDLVWAPGNDTPVPDRAVKDRLVKSRRPDHWFDDDIVLGVSELGLLQSGLDRLKRIQRLVGYGKFCLLGFDDARTYARSYTRVGPFTKAELNFLEKIFYSPAGSYGFMGEKPITDMTGTVNSQKVTKVLGTGNYLYAGRPREVYAEILKKIGRDVVLTSGIRGVMKQFLLFLDKANRHQGNLSLASRSLAPPGYSFHGVGDFDVGERGFGVDNFTEKFTQTRVYNRLTDLGFVKFRYDRENTLGVRFEPWHVGVG